MRTLTLLELLAAWEEIPHDHFLVVTVPRTTRVVHDEYIERFEKVLYQRGCCSKSQLPWLERDIKRSASLTCDLLSFDLVALKLAEEPPVPYCAGCHRPVSEHWSLSNCEEIVDSVLS